jgi:hypothetical protein
VSKILNTINSGKTVGEFFTRSYASPEQLGYKDIDFSTDIFSLAGVAFFLFSHHDPVLTTPLANQFETISLPEELAVVLKKMAAPDVSSRFDSAHQALIALKKAKKSIETETQKIFVQLTNNAIKNLYDQTIIKSQQPEEAKAYIRAALDCDEVFICTVKDVDEESYDLLGDGVSLRCSLANKKGGEFLSLVVRSIQSLISPHQLEKFRQNGYPIHAKWKIGLVQDPIPLNSTGLSTIIDQIDNYIQNKQVEQAKRERRVDLVEGWLNILELDRELKSQQIFQMDYSSWNYDEKHQTIAIQITTEAVLEEVLALGQLLLMSSKLDRNIPVGHFIKQEGNSILISRLRDLDFNMLSPKGKISADERQWAAAWNRQRQALFTIINGRCINSKLPDILLDPLQAELKVINSIDHFYNNELDDHKKDVVNQSLGAKDVFLIQGPPGTGKTVVITEIIAQQLVINPRSRILLVSQSNVAVDHVLAKVVKLLPNVLIVRIGKEENLSSDAFDYYLDQQLSLWARSVQQKSYSYSKSQYKESEERSDLEFYLDVLLQLLKIVETRNSDDNEQPNKDANDWLVALNKRFPELDIKPNKKSLNDAVQSIQSRIDKYKSEIELVLVEWGKRLHQPRDFEEAYLEVCSIVAGTCVGIAGKRNLPNRFDLAIVDEAGRATPSELLIPLVRAEKCILVGDHKQLPPVFDYTLQAEAKNRNNIDPIWLKQSLFEYLFNNLDSGLKTTLTVQYRMHPNIAKLISEVFYNFSFR